VIIIEDAESVLADRRVSYNSSVSNLLNISDGLLADFLNVQLICTFNNALTMVDSALMRKGRLIAKYEFGKLSVEKAQRLSDKMGFGRKIEAPMTLAEIMHPADKSFEEEQRRLIGFRRALIEN
jgi:ATP-dependent 26S proteasome regulatory subunit